VSAFSHPRSRAGSLAYRSSRERAPSRYRTLSAAAANVASAAAALATQRNEPSTSPHISNRWSRRSLDGLLDTDRRRLSRQDNDDVDDDTLAMLGDSFHSDWAGRHKHVFPSKESQPLASHSRSRSRQGMPSSSIPAALQITSATDDFDPSTRGRSLHRANYPSLDSRGEHTWLSSEDGSQGRRSPRASRRGASMVFMGAWALFGIGTLSIRGHSGESGVAVLRGKVLSSSSLTPPSLSFPSPTYESPPLATVDLVFDAPQFEHVPNPPPVAGPPIERVIGRISAWACTTLYLTSRLPQIWKNVGV
jgi:solute carrier family 66 (lysosomal lysine-arginine transporter), member 1